MFTLGILSLVSHQALPPTPPTLAAAASPSFRSIIGDPGMLWADASAAAVPPPDGNPAAQGPRMQLFFYNLCSKAGYANMSVVPAPATDTCETVPGEVIGFGAVETVAADDCCAACLARPWCLAWTHLGPAGACELKDNALPQRAPLPVVPSDFVPRQGNCGGTDWSDPSTCQTAASGAVRAREHNISSFSDCARFCEGCAACYYVSFSLGAHGAEKDHDDCSWYSACDVRHLTPDAANYTSAAVKNTSAALVSGVRRFRPAQALPSPRYANCVVGGAQTVATADNGAVGAPGVDAEWFAAQKEAKLAEKCAVPAPPTPTPTPTPTPSYFWTLMSQNGNAQGSLGTAGSECLPYCFVRPPPGATGPCDDCYPPAVNASAARCEQPGAWPPPPPPGQRRLGFNGFPMNQAKVMTALTDPAADPLRQRGSFNWTFELDADLAVPEEHFPANKSLGIWSWERDAARGGRGRVRVYQRVSALYPWIVRCPARAPAAAAAVAGAAVAPPAAPPPLLLLLLLLLQLLLLLLLLPRASPTRNPPCPPHRLTLAPPHYRTTAPLPQCTYFGADVGRGVKGNQAYDGRGMLTEAPRVGEDFVVRFFLNITKDQIGGGGGIGSWYLLNMEACWDQRSGAPCRPYGDTNRNAHNQVLLDYGGDRPCSAASPHACPPYHRWRNGSLVANTDAARFPYSAYKFYCCPCTACAECDGTACCDPLSNPDGQSIYKLAPDAEWAVHGFPANATDGWVGHPKMHELHVGALWEQIWFPCMTNQSIEIITLNIGPETGLGTGTHDTEFFISDFDVLVPV